MDEVVQTMGLRFEQLKESVRDRMGSGDMWSESSPGDVCVPAEQSDKVLTSLLITHNSKQLDQRMCIIGYIYVR